MPRHCSAGGCNSRDTKEARVAGVTFHRLPKRGDPRRDTWILNSRRKGPGGVGQWEPQSDFVYFCSKHFTPESFEVTGVSGYHRLKDDAIPTRVEKSSCRIIRRKSKPRKKTLEKQTSGGTGTDDPRSGTQETQIEEPPVPSVTEGSRTSPENPAPAQDEPLDLTVGPPSPSCYMRRLPPPDGFYVAKEHSYALVYPLVWRRSYEKAISSLQKALRLLSAARRRENRLRLALTRLREGRFKKAPSHIQDQKREGLDQTSWPCETGRTTRSDLEERELEGASEEILSEEERLGLVGSGRSARPEAGAEDEEGYCFYCGRAREDEDPKEDASRRRSRRRTPGGDSPVPAVTVLPPDKVAYLQMLHLHLLQQDVSADSGAAQTKDEGLCRMFLVPVSAKDRGGIAVESGVPSVETQSVPAAEDGRQPDELLSVETGLVELRDDVLGCGQNCHEIKVRVVGGDVKQRLKEHLEGFQLQLSNEFTD